jgi:hypothetical protein
MKQDLEWHKFPESIPDCRSSVIVKSADGRVWIGYKCVVKNCNKLHYQSDSLEANYIRDPVRWAYIPQEW